MRLEVTTKIVIMFVSVALAFTVIDLLTTYVAVSGGAQELNPTIANDIVSFGLVNALLLSLITPLLASTVSVSGSIICNRTINTVELKGFTLKGRRNLKLFVSIGLAALLTVVIITRGLAVCNNTFQFLGVV